MKNPFKYLRLPESETFTIQTSLSKGDVIAKIKRLTGTSYISSSFFWFKSAEPKFMGKFLDDGFEVYLQRDVVGHNKPVFSPPMIKATVLGEISVQIHTKLEFHWFQRGFHSVWTGSSLLFTLLWMLAVPVIFFFGIWASPPSPEIVSSGSSEVVQGVGVLGVTMAFLAIWLLPLLLELVFFLWLPQRMIVRTMKRSKALMLELYGEDVVAPN